MNNFEYLDTEEKELVESYEKSEWQSIANILIEKTS